CSNPFRRGGWAVGASDDGGRTLTPRATFGDILGAVACEAGAPGAVCAAAWPETRAVLEGTAPAADDDEPASPDGGGARPPSSAAAAASASAATAPSTTRAEKSCGCRTAGAPRSSGEDGGFAFGCTAFALLAASRKRARGLAMDRCGTKR